MPKIRFKRGLKTNLPVLDEGEPAFTTDTEEFFIGSQAGNIELAKQADLDSTNVQVTSNTDALNNLANVSPNAELLAARGTYPLLGGRLDNVDSSLAQKVTYASGLLLGDQTKATANATLLNQLLSQGNVRLPIGDIYIDNTLTIPANTKLLGEKDKTNIKLTNPTKDIIRLSSLSYVGNLNLTFPNSGATGSAIKMVGSDNITHPTIENILITGYAPFVSGETSIGINMEGTAAGYIYYANIRNVKVTNCYYGVYQFAQTAFINGNRFTDLFLENCTWEMNITGSGNTFFYTSQVGTNTIHNVTCSGGQNVFHGVVYDLFQGNSNAGILAYEFNGHSTGNLYLDWDGNWLRGTIFDAGTNNRCMNSNFEIKQFLSYGETRGVDSLGQSTQLPGFYGMQDNALAFMDKRGTVALNTGTITYGSVGKMFNPSQTFDGTNFSDPSVTPIEFTADFPSSMSNVIYMGIIFDSLAYATNFEIWTKTTQGGSYSKLVGINNNTRSNYVFNPSITGVSPLWGIKIKITQAFTTSTQNTSKQIVIKSVWCTDGANGGQTYFKQSGGKVYGQLDMNGNTMTIGNIVSTWVPASGDRGKFARIQGGTNVADINYICNQLPNNTYEWTKIPITHYGTVTYNGDGSTISKTIAHGLGGIPAHFSVDLASSDAGNAGKKYATADATNITIYFNTAPVTGTNNVVLTWKAML